MSSTYAVLFDIAETAAFVTMVTERPEVTHVWVVTDSHSAFVEVKQELPVKIVTGQLYSEYLRNFRLDPPGVVD